MSSSCKIIGRISEGLNKGDFDWVMNICSDKILEEFYNVKSPTFSFASISWHVEMTNRFEKDYISIYLHKNDLEIKKCMTMSLTVIFLGKELLKPKEGSVIYGNDLKPYGLTQCITRKDLLDCLRHASNICGEMIVRIKLRDHVPCNEDGLFKIRLNGKEALCQNYKDMLLDGEDHDLILKVKEKEFKAHRNIMKSRCPVFKSMLSHETLEKNSGVVDIPDCDPAAFEQFLLYIYTGELVEVLDKSTVLDLYFIADKYNMESLREECCTFIKESLSVHVVCNVIKLALDHSDSALLEFATKYFVSNAKGILITEEWMSLYKAHPIQANELMIKALNQKFSYCCACRPEVGALAITFLYPLCLVVFLSIIWTILQ